MELTFTLTVEEANTLLRGLGKLPFEEVANLITKLNTQASPQMTAKVPDIDPVKED